MSTSLIFRRGQLKSSLTRFWNYVSTPGNDAEQIKIRKIKVEEVWNEFQTVQAELDGEAGGDMEEHELYRREFEDIFFKAITLANNRLRQVGQNDSIRIRDDEDNDISAKHIFNNTFPSVKLAALNIPVFSGVYEDWAPFYDIFSALVHNNNSLTPIQKFFYLRSSLSDNAASCIKNLETTASNYEHAWDNLITRFNNKKLLVQSHVKGICELPRVRENSSVTLRQFSDNLCGHISALKTLEQRPLEWGPLLTHIICTKLDAATISEWESKSKINEVAKVEELIKYLDTRSHMLEAVETTKNMSKPSNDANFENKFLNTKNKFQNKFNARFSTTSKSFAITGERKCYVCNLPHVIYKCPSFVQLSVLDRIKRVDELNLCKICLCRHEKKKCLGRHCFKCSKPHNTMLHLINSQQNSPAQSISNITNNNNNSIANEPSTSTSAHTFVACEQILLSTALVTAVNPTLCVKTLPCRVLLDSGSQTNFITEELVQTLRLKKEKINHVINGIGETTQRASSSVFVRIKSRVNDYELNLKMIVVPKITGQLPPQNVQSKCLVPDDIRLADPLFSTPQRVDMLLGASHFFDILRDGQIRASSSRPLFQKTVFGWIAAGPVPSSEAILSAANSRSFFVTKNEPTLEDILQRFWCVENLGDTPPFTTEERICQEYFKNTVRRNNEGRFVVSLPFRDNAKRLGNSYAIAKRRLLSIERKCQRDVELKNEYKNFMREYEQLGHMERIKEDGDNVCKNVCYLPHHGVRKDSSTSTKLRVVFDASCKTETGVSLNDALLKGPVIQDDLLYILARFRTHNYVLTADIAKMYRQILVADEQRDFQRILWRESPEEPIRIYRLNTITYGTVPASYLATGCLQVLAETERKNHPYVAPIIMRDFYMDDLLTGAETKEEAARIRDGIISIMNSAGLKLRKWSSNDMNSILSSLPSEDVEVSNSYEIDSTVKRVLGLFWDASSDTLKYKVRQSTELNDNIITKRGILSDIAAIFDPLGLVGPVVVQAKIMLQSVWREKIDWDEPVPIDTRNQWFKYRTFLEKLNSLSIPRKLSKNLRSCSIEIHGFSDASVVAYGCCLYVRCTNSSGVHYTNLICAKSKVAPLKTLSLPRLELCAALLLVRLAHKLIPKLHLNVARKYFWTDSTIVLSWISSPSAKWKTFVAHRVSEIQEKTAISEWQHVNTHDNPADVISRGCCPSKLAEISLWWSGPTWLTREKHQWPQETAKTTKDTLEDILEAREQSTNSMCTVRQTETILDKFESLNKCIRVTAYCLRFLNNTSKNIKLVGVLSPVELKNANLKLVKFSQNIFFGDELRDLKNNKFVAPKSKLFRLKPFLDDDGIIRVGGRLKHAATIDVFQRHPMVLAANCEFTKKLVRREHERLMHGGPQTILSSIRLKYWPINGRNLARNILRKCVRCFRNKPIVVQPIMGDLPNDRVQPGRAFLKCGVDFAGPFLIKSSLLRKAPIVKSYACIFVCFTTKAVHIELVSNLTTQAFLNALNRFFDRRGKSVAIYSDNATNFVGANRRLKEVYQFFYSEQNQKETKERLNDVGVNWHFIPPRSPHFGGLWEAAVKSMKILLGRVLGEAHLTYEEMNTILTRAEACLNSRPLTTLSADPTDTCPLTPGHFLIGDSLTAVPEGDTSDLPVNRLTRWRRVTQYSHQLWRRWSKEYLGQLQERSKWSSAVKGPKLDVGSVVLVKEDNLPPLRWRLGVVTTVYRGSDDVVRAADVRSSEGQFRRAVRQLCPLPIDDNPE